MNNKKKSRKLLFVATVLTIVALVTVLTVYAAVFLGTIIGGTVTVGSGSESGAITYNTNSDGSGTWSSSLQPTGPWYAQLALDSGYTGPVTITWTLQSDASGTWTNVGTNQTTTMILSGAAQDVYATSTGVITGNYNWNQQATSAGAYRLIATVDSSP